MKINEENDILEYLIGEELKQVGWTLCFITDKEIFLRNRATAELAKEFGDLASEIENMIHETVALVEKEFHNFKPILIKINKIISNIDVY